MSRRNSRVIETQLKQIDAIFRAHSVDPPAITVLEVKKDKKCDVHARRGSTDSTRNLSRKESLVSTTEGKRNSYCSTEKLNENFRKKNRNSIASFTELVERSVTPNGFVRDAVERELTNRPRRESMPIIDNGSKNGKKNPLDNFNSRLFKGMEHPSNFPNMLRSSSGTLNAKNGDMGRRASSNWNVNHFHNYNGNSNLDKKQSLSTSDKLFKRDYTSGSSGSTGSSPEPKKELHSILKQKKSDEDDLKEIIKRLSFDYIEKEWEARNGNKMDVDLLSNSDSSSGGTGRSRTPITSIKATPRRISIDSLDSRRSSRRLSDFSMNGDDDDDMVTLKNRLNRSSVQVSASRRSNCAIENRFSKVFACIMAMRHGSEFGLSDLVACNMKIRKCAAMAFMSKHHDK